MHEQRAQVGEQAERFAQAEQTFLRTARPALPLRPANRAQQHGVSAAACGQGVRRQRVAGGVYRGAADQVSLECEAPAETLADAFKHLARDERHLRPDSVAGKKDDVVPFHAACSWRFS